MPTLPVKDFLCPFCSRDIYWMYNGSIQRHSESDWTDDEECDCGAQVSIEMEVVHKFTMTAEVEVAKETKYGYEVIQFKDESGNLIQRKVISTTYLGAKTRSDAAYAAIRDCNKRGSMYIYKVIEY